MNKHNLIRETIQNDAFLPLFYNSSESVCIAITKSLYEVGVRCIEFTNRGANALANFKALVHLKETIYPDLLLGIGTIKSVEDAQAYLEAKADFLISPFFDPQISDYANQQKALWIPGCMTPSEINAALKGGHQLIKLFPGNILSPQFISAIKPLFPEAVLMVTGGVTTEEENLKSWFGAGAAAVGMGSNLIPNQFNSEGEYKILEEKTRQTKSLIQKIKNK